MEATVATREAKDERHLHTVHELLTVLEQPTAEMMRLRTLLSEQGRFPARRTWERRLHALPASLPAQIGCLGRQLASMIQPWTSFGRAVAIDSTILQARGGVWHQKHREKGELPHTSIDTEAHWTKSGWHGWVYGWKLRIVCVVAGVWFPLAAVLTPANIADSEPAPHLLREVPAEVRFVLGDHHYNTPELRETAPARTICWLLPSMGNTRILMMGSRFDAFSINCVRWLLKILTGTKTK